MRYQEIPEQVDKIASVSPNWVMGTAIYTLLLGIGFVVFSVRVRKFRVGFWGGTMVIAGTAYLIAGLNGFA